MSIFVENNNVEELLNNDDSIDIFHTLLTKFVENYNDINLHSEKINNFFTDAKKLFGLISKYYKIEVEEYKKEEDFNKDSPEFKKLEKLILNCDELLNLLPSDNQVISEENKNKINNLCLEITEFHKEVLESINEINQMMSDTCDKLDIVGDQLDIVGDQLEINSLINRINEIRNEIVLMQKNDLSISNKVSELSDAYNKFKILKDKILIQENNTIYDELEQTIFLLLCKFGIEGIKLS